MDKIRILIADDHELILDGLKSIFKNSMHFALLGVASNGQELLELIDKVNPEIVLTDIRMPVLDGIAATQLIRKHHPNIEVIGLSSYDEEALILDMLNAGAKGYLLKSAKKEEIFKAINTVYHHEVYYSTAINEHLAEILSRRTMHFNRRQTKDLFSERELQVIALICEGLPSKMIANQLGLKPRTVERYRDTIMEKMDVNNVAAAVVYAVVNELFHPPKTFLK